MAAILKGKVSGSRNKTKEVIHKARVTQTDLEEKTKERVNLLTKRPVVNIPQFAE